MVSVRKTAALVAIAHLCLPAFAQDDAELVREDEVRPSVVEVEQQSEIIRQPSSRIEIEVRMQDAEQRLADAARRVADLSMAQLPRVERLERIIQANRGPVLGVTIGSDDNNAPVEGVNILGVSPGGAAEGAGLRAGDVITSINNESLTADNSQEANEKLLDFMQGVEEGDALDVEYLRDSKSATIEVTPRPMDGNIFAFGFPGGNFSAPDAHIAHQAHHSSVILSGTWMVTVSVIWNSPSCQSGWAVTSERTRACWLCVRPKTIYNWRMAMSFSTLKVTSRVRSLMQCA